MVIYFSFLLSYNIAKDTRRVNVIEKNLSSSVHQFVFRPTIRRLKENFDIAIRSSDNWEQRRKSRSKRLSCWIMIKILKSNNDWFESDVKRNFLFILLLHLSSRSLLVYNYLEEWPIYLEFATLKFYVKINQLIMSNWYETSARIDCEKYISRTKRRKNTSPSFGNYVPFLQT